jgi:tetratricopeptide (TPR) repeat protein
MRAIALALSLVALEAAQPPNRTAVMLRDWITAVDQHRTGESDAALSVICNWTDDDLGIMRASLESFVGAPKNSDARRRRLSNLTQAESRTIREEARSRMGNDGDGFRRRAVMLHTDAALVCAPPVIAKPPEAKSPDAPRWARQRSERRIDVLSQDAQFQNIEFNNLHWEVAMDMLDALPSSPPDPLVARWYAAVGAHFLWQRRYADALVHFDRARALVPGDPDVLYMEARVHETLSGPRMQNFVRVTTLGNGNYIAGIDSRQAELRRAESLLQRALVARPGFTGARLRLGRVLMQQRRWEEGRRLVQQAASESKDEFEQYFAHLFAGDGELALGKVDDARRSYERALALFPEAQAPRLGLADAIRAHGEPAEAIDAIMPTLTKDPDGRADDDPFWEYYEGRAEDVEAVIEAMRAPFTVVRQ